MGAPRTVKQKVVCSAFLSSSAVASSVHPTPLATLCRVPCGVVLLLVLALYGDPNLTTVVTLQVTLAEKHLHNHLE